MISTLHLTRDPQSGAYTLTETIETVLSKDLLAALRLIVGTLYIAAKPGWVEFRGVDENDGVDASRLVLLSQAITLESHGLLERDQMAWHRTYLITEKGKRVVALMNELAPKATT